MALMIPPILPEDAPRSERVIFSRLRDDPFAERWVVFHSRTVPLSRRRRREIDFLVLIPSVGMLSLEVKGGDFAVVGGQWYPSNPYTQARAAMFSLKDQITEKFGREWAGAQLVLDYVVIFTDTNMPAGNRDTGEWTIGERDLRGSKTLAQQLLNIAQETRMATADSNVVLDFNESVILKYLDWEGADVRLNVFPRPSPVQDPIEKRIARLTSEQYAALSSADANDRVLFKGRAGTGKTMLALELAKRKVAAGERVALLCYNKILGDFLYDVSREFANLHDAVGGIWYHFLFSTIERLPSINNTFNEEMNMAKDNDERFNVIAPHYLISALEDSEKYDYLIVDELQDMCADPYLHIFDSALKGGLLSGRWAMFADFDQFTGDRVPDSAEENLYFYCDEYLETRLNINVRNTRQIAMIADKVIDPMFAPVYETPVRGGPAPTCHYWQDAGELRIQLDGTVRDLLALGENIADVVVLRTSGSSHSEDNATDADLLMREYGGYRLWDCPGIYFPPVDACEQRPCCRMPRFNGTYLNLRTVRRFKGMESKIIVLIVDNVATQAAETALYVGLTRASTRLIVLANEATRPYLSRRLRLS